MMKRLPILIALLIASTTAACADFHAPELRFSHFTTDNGLPSNRIPYGGNSISI